MMLRNGLIFLAVLGFVSSLRADDPPKPTYDALVAQAKKGEAKVDFARMRIAYTETKVYNPISIDDATNRMNQAFAMLEYPMAIAAAEKVLEKKFVDLSAHRIAAESFDELDQPEKAKFHRAIYEGLMQSILSSGNGQSTKSAYVVIAADEEYEVLNRLGIRSEMQGLLREDGKAFDRIDGLHRATKKRVAVYFDASIPFQAIEKAFKR